MTRRAPCPTCPWRVEQHADEIPQFDLALAERLVSTTGTEFGAPQFACHQSREGEEIVCAGWLCRYGWDNIGVRLGRYKPEELEPPPEGWPEMHETFEEVIAKLREDCA